MATNAGFLSTLQSIRRGGPDLSKTLAGQISNIRAERAAAQREYQQNLRDYMLEKANTESEMRRRAVQSQTDLDEARRARAAQMNEKLFGVSRGLMSLAESNPNEAQARLSQSPRLAGALNVDPTSPNWREQLRSAHDRYRAQVTGEIPGKEGDPRTALERQLESAGLKPGTPEYRKALLRSIGGMEGKEEDPRTALQKQLESAGLKPGTSEYREALLRSIGGMAETEGGERVVLVRGGTPEAEIMQSEYKVNIPGNETAEVKFNDQGDVIDVNRFGAATPSGPTAFQEKMGGVMSSIYEEDIKRGIRAPDTLRRLDAVEQSLLTSQGEGFKTGFAGNLRQLASQAFEYFNVDPGIANLGEASTSEIVDSISSRLAIDLAEGLSRPNNMQTRLIVRAIPNLGKTVQGNLILTNMLQQKARRDKAISDIATAFGQYSQNGVSLDQNVNVAGVTLERGDTYSDAIEKYDDKMGQMDEETRRYIRNAAKWGEAKIAPTGTDGNKIDPAAMEDGGIYLMPDGRVLEYSVDGKSKILDDLSKESNKDE